MKEPSPGDTAPAESAAESAAPSPPSPPPTRRGPPRPPPRIARGATPEAAGAQPRQTLTQLLNAEDSASAVPVSGSAESSEAAPITPLELRMDDATVIGAAPAELLALAQRELEAEATSLYVVPPAVLSGAHEASDEATSEGEPEPQPSMARATPEGEVSEALPKPDSTGRASAEVSADSPALDMPIEVTDPMSQRSWRQRGTEDVPPRWLRGWRAQELAALGVLLLVAVAALCYLLA